jgi:hypothetical protein
MPEPLSLPTSTTPIPSVLPAGVTVEGAPQPVQQAVTPVVEAAPAKDHLGFLKQIDWVEAIIVVAAITGIIYAINYYSTQIKSQNGAIATLNSDIADLQNKVQSLIQEKNSSSTAKNVGGDIDRLF